MTKLVFQCLGWSFATDSKISSRERKDEALGPFCRFNRKASVFPKCFCSASLPYLQRREDARDHDCYDHLSYLRAHSWVCWLPRTRRKEKQDAKGHMTISVTVDPESSIYIQDSMSNYVSPTKAAISAFRQLVFIPDPHWN